MIKSWILATRPKTLTAAIIPIIVPVSLAKNLTGSVDWFIALCSLVTALLIQVGTNVINDALDFKKGADTAARLGPVRVTQSGLLSMQTVYTGGLLIFALAMLTGVPLVIKGGMPIAYILAASVASGYLYTGGPFPLAYKGLGELFVILFYGIIAPGAVYYLQTGTIDPIVFLAGAQVGLLATMMIAINNLRDRCEDSTTGKCTLAVRLGCTFARLEITACAIIPFLFNIIWWYMGYTLAALLSSVAIPLALDTLRRIWKNQPGIIYNHYLAQAGLLQISFGCLLSLSFWLE